MTTQEAIAHFRMVLDLNEKGAEYNASRCAYFEGLSETAFYTSRCEEVQFRRAAVAAGLAILALQEMARREGDKPETK